MAFAIQTADAISIKASGYAFNAKLFFADNVEIFLEKGVGKMIFCLSKSTFTGIDR